MTIADLAKGEIATITDVSDENIPLKLMEMGCLPGNTVEVVQFAPFSDPIYVNINGSHIAIRKGTASLVKIKKSDG